MGFESISLPTRPSTARDGLCVPKNEREGRPVRADAGIGVCHVRSRRKGRWRGFGGSGVQANGVTFIGYRE